jgi:hypothetical protein
MKLSGFVALASFTWVGLTVFDTTAQALPMKAVWTGTVGGIIDGTRGDVNDPTHVFGGDSRDALTGATFTFTEIFDPDTLGSKRNTTPTLDEVGGGSVYYLNAPSPILSSMLEINGHTETFDGNYRGAVSFQSIPNSNDVYTVSDHYFFYGNGDGDTSTIFLIGYALAGVPNNLNTPYSLVFDRPGNGGYFEFNHYVNAATSYYTKFSRGSLNPASVTFSNVNVVSAVPIPAALPLLATGLGAMGVFASRKRRSKT